MVSTPPTVKMRLQVNTDGLDDAATALISFRDRLEDGGFEYEDAVKITIRMIDEITAYENVDVDIDGVAKRASEMVMEEFGKQLHGFRGGALY